MDDRRAGTALRALRRRRDWRQVDVAREAGLSQQAVSLIERGHLGRLSIDRARRVFAAVDAGFDGTVRWRGGELDRLLDERHAALVGAFATELRGLGRDVALEVTFSMYGERGSIDLLALHTTAGTLLVVEAKTEIASIEELIRRLDVKVRLAAGLSRTQFGRTPTAVGRVVVVLDGATARRRVDRQASTLLMAFPGRGAGLRSWLRRPSGAVSGLLFFSATNRGGGIRKSDRVSQVPGSQRVRRRRSLNGARTTASLPSGAAEAGFLDSTTPVGE